MPVIKCPVPNCEYETEDLDAVVVAALLTAHTTIHSAGGNISAKVEKVKRPTVSAAGSSEDWTYFLSRWKDYVQATKIQGKDLVIQLLECCDESLRRDLTRSAGGSLVDKSEQDVLQAMRTLAVREENTMVARVALHGMTQDRDETVRSFGARLRGQAGVCKFTMTCPGCNQDVDYTEAILRDVLTRGLSDPDIQLDLLGDKNQDMTLEQVFKFVEAKESGKRSASRLLDTQGVEAASSTYRRRKMNNITNDVKKLEHKTELCGYCGKKGHGKHAPHKTRKKECPAYGHRCSNCDRDNHFESVCRQKVKTKQSEESESAVFDLLCTATNSQHENKAIQLDHHLYSQMSDTWEKRPSQPQPFINITVKVVEDDYNQLGFNAVTSHQRNVVIPAMADTGCQSCLAGIKVLHKIGIKQTDLIPVNMKMHAANNKGITILGAIVVRLSGKDRENQKHETRQIVYITDSSDKFFLSKEACIALGMISQSFPTIGEIIGTTTSSVIDNDISMESQCDCPKRQAPPQIPDKLPFPATEENVPKLRDFLLEHYKSSTFNTCEHQLLPLMEGPPLKLMIDPDATPIACHTPVPVPLHWQDDVKAGLDQDVRLGVIEPVPVGEPVTWCHRMVVCAKKNGKPRRTVDFQALNAHAIRETHHTQSPFHQARSVPQDKKKKRFLMLGTGTIAFRSDRKINISLRL